MQKGREETDSNAQDLESIHLTLQGDTEAFRGIIEKYQSAIIRLCRSYLKNEEEAEDAAQEIFLRAFKSLSSFRIEKTFFSWLYTIAVNHLKSRYAKIRKLQERREEIQKERQPDPETPEDITARNEMKREVKAAIDGLPEKLKDVTVLYYIEELSVERVAEILGLSRENVKSRLFRARKKIRGKLEKMQPNKDNEST